MANRFGQILQIVGKKNSFGSLSRSNFVHCWGSNTKVRNYHKLLGLSASIVVIGCGFHCLNEEGEIASGRLRKRLTLGFGSYINRHPQSVPVFQAHNGIHHMSPFSLLKLIGLITPASCSGEDYVCNCRRSDPGSAQGPASTSTISGQNECSNSEGSSKNQEQSGNKVCNCKSQSNPNPVVSNKPCYSASNAACVPDVDIESLAAELGGVKQIDWVAESDLSHCHLIRQASQVTVDSVTRILTETASAYEDYQVEYRRLLNMMMDTLEESRKACGAELEVIDCKIILIRAKLDEMKLRIRDLDMFLCSLEKLGSASSETAFIAHAEYASIALSERMQSVGLEVKRLRDETKEKERDMLELQSLIIVETGRSLK